MNFRKPDPSAHRSRAEHHGQLLIMIAFTCIAAAGGFHAAHQLDEASTPGRFATLGSTVAACEAQSIDAVGGRLGCSHGGDGRRIRVMEEGALFMRP